MPRVEQADPSRRLRGLCCAWEGGYARELRGTWNRNKTQLKIKMAAGEPVELSQLPIPHLENLRSQLEEASIDARKGILVFYLSAV